MSKEKEITLLGMYMNALSYRFNHQQRYVLDFFKICVGYNLQDLFIILMIKTQRHRGTKE